MAIWAIRALEDHHDPQGTHRVSPAPHARRGTRRPPGGVKTLLNFAPTRLRVPRDVRLKNVDLSIELETLSFYLVRPGR